MAVFIDENQTAEFADQHDLDGNRFREGSLAHYDREMGSVRPLDLSSDEFHDINSIVLKKEHSHEWQPLTKVHVEVNDGERTIIPSENTDATEFVNVWPTGNENLPISNVRTGSEVLLRSVTEHCDAVSEHEGDHEGPLFHQNQRVSLVPDVGSVDGIRVAPTEYVDDRFNSIPIGSTTDFPMHKSQKRGFNELIPVSVSR